MNHSIIVSPDGTLIVRIPEAFRIERVQVGEIGTEKAQMFLPALQEWQKLFFAYYHETERRTDDTR